MEFSSGGHPVGDGSDAGGHRSVDDLGRPSASSAQELMELFDHLDAVLDEVVEVDVASADAADRLWSATAAARLAARVEAVRCSLVGAADRVDAASVEGLGSTASWLKQAGQMSGRSASREVKRARVLRQLPAVAAGFADGVLSVDQIDVFVRCHNPRTAAAMARDEALLLELAKAATVDRFAAELRGWELVDTDGVEPDPGHRDRGLSMVQGFDGSWAGSFTMGSGDGATVAAAIDAVAERLRVQDRRDGVARTESQRRVDAMAELVLGRVSTSVTFNVVVRADDLDGGVYSSRLACDSSAPTVGGTWLSAADTLRWAAAASIRTVVLDPVGGAVLRFGRSRRLASPSQRVALSIETDGVCGFVGCEHRVDDAHHIVEWDHGGLTDMVNLVGLCHEHHDLVHDHGWSLTKTGDGTLQWQRPDGEPLDPLPGWARRHSPPSRERRERAEMLRRFDELLQLQSSACQ